MAEIYIEKLYKEYGKVAAVRDFTLRIENGELMLFLGPSGCGKTTTLNCIAGLEAPTSGRIYFDGEDVTDMPPHRRNVAMVFQSSLLYPHLSSRKNIDMSLRSRKLTKQEMNQLMDEPLASLDAAMRETLRVELVVLQKRIGITMVFVTHDQVEAMTIADRIVVMHQGGVQQVGTPMEIYNKPANLFVAGHVGSPPMNFFEGSINTTDHGLEFVHSSFHLALTKETANVIREQPRDKRYVLGVRPSSIDLSANPVSDSLRGRVYGVELLGKETIVIIEYEGGRIKTTVPPSFSYSMGDSVYALPQPEAIYLFDADSGENLIT
ncbi:Trehalose import ATP-binding protein SugC [subsurface metagenome]